MGWSRDETRASVDIVAAGFNGNSLYHALLMYI